MKMTVTHGYLLQLANILARPELVFDGECQGSIAYKIFMNRKTAMTYQEAFAQAFPPDPEMAKYAEERRGIFAEVDATTPECNDDCNETDAETLSKRKADDNARKQALLTEKIAELDKKYAGAIEKARATEIEREKTLAEKVEVDLYTVSPNDIKIKTADPMYPNSTQNAWLIWAILYNDGQGIIRESV